MSNESQAIDNTPMLVKHGRVVWRDVVATKATAEAILGLLNPDDASPVLDSLTRIEAMLSTLLTILAPPTAGADAP
jgi:hypothetical protein